MAGDASDASCAEVVGVSTAERVVVGTVGGVVLGRAVRAAFLGGSALGESVRCGSGIACEGWDAKGSIRLEEWSGKTGGIRRGGSVVSAMAELVKQATIALIPIILFLRTIIFLQKMYSDMKSKIHATFL